MFVVKDCKSNVRKNVESSRFFFILDRLVFMFSFLDKLCGQFEIEIKSDLKLDLSFIFDLL